MKTNIRRTTIGIFSSSSPIGYHCPKRLERSINYLKNNGFEIIEGNLLRNNDFYRTGCIEARAREVNDLISKDIDILMSSIGGTNTNAVLPYIDYNKINQKELIVCGFSDTTALLLAIIRKSPNARVFYGPALVPTFGDCVEDKDFKTISLNSFKERLDNFPTTYSIPEYWTDQSLNWESFEKPKTYKVNKWHFLNSNEIISGRLIGGNLNSLMGTWGSEFGLDIKKGDILLIEDSQKDAAIVEKNFAFLKINGVFDKVGAIILGKHELFDDQGSGRQPIDILIEVLNGQNLPIIYDLDFCHTKPMLIVELNRQITIDFKEKSIKSY